VSHGCSTDWSVFPATVLVFPFTKRIGGIYV
jgi:hypothetical protein